MDFPHVETPFIIALWILVSSLAKVGKKIMRTAVGIYYSRCPSPKYENGF